MQNLIAKIEQVDADHFAPVLSAVCKRYAALFPDWEVNVITIRKNDDRNAQIDSIIQMLQNMKE